MLARYNEGQFTEEYNQTAGANFLIKEIDLSRITDRLNIKNPELKKDVKEKGFKLYFWDIGGQHDKLFSNEYYFNHAVGAMVIFNLNDVSTFQNVDFWIEKLIELSGKVPYIIVGNKSDLERKVPETDIRKKVSNLGVEYFETSAKENTNVNKAFENLSIQVLNTLK